MTPQMIYLSNKKKFFRFLKEHGIYAAYRRNFDIEHLKKWSISIYDRIKCDGEDFYNVVNPEHYISGAFAWTYTPEGNDFWVNLHFKWIGEVYGY